MLLVLCFVNVLVFIILSSIHFYWVFGGEKWLDKALPTDIDGNKLFVPGKIATAFVAIGLLFFAFFYVVKSGLIDFQFPVLISKYLGWGISIIFILRAFGDFKYSGFTKKIKNTDFGKFDTKYYSKISLVLGVIGLTIELFK